MMRHLKLHLRKHTTHSIHHTQCYIFPSLCLLPHKKNPNENKNGGRSHSKAVLILAHYGWCFWKMAHPSSLKSLQQIDRQWFP
uniref:Uncharacterized protein n=1 Tax=Arundo donax TaxID=35708 RepID=A0A0A9GC53_ARUDO